MTHPENGFAVAIVGGMATWLVATFAAESYLRKTEPFHEDGRTMVGHGAGTLVARLLLSLATMKRYVWQRRHNNLRPTWAAVYGVGMFVMLAGCASWAVHSVHPRWLERERTIEEMRRDPHELDDLLRQAREVGR